MSGYRIIHRHEITSIEGSEEGKTQQEPTWSVCFSPCNQTHAQKRNDNTKPSSSSPLRLLASSADGIIRAFRLTDKSSLVNKDILDASALSMTVEQVLLPTSNTTYPRPKEESDSRLTLGSAALSSIRNYVGEDPKAGSEVSASLRLDGYVSIWLRDEQPIYPSDDKDTKNIPHVVKPDHEFRIQNATGTTLVLIPPQLTGYSKHGVVMMVGCLDGSVAFISSGVGMPDTRKGNDTSKASDPGTILDTVGSGSCPMSIAVQPKECLTFAVGRKDGTIDIFNSGIEKRDNVYGNFRRCHRLHHHSGSPVRALCYTPDGSLLISGCDNGHLYIHDTSSFLQNETIRMVAVILNAHRSYILAITVLPDSRRFMTSSADGTAKVWDVSIPNSGAVHTFDTGRDEMMIWDLACSLDGSRCVSCSDDGLVQVYSID